MYVDMYGRWNKISQEEEMLIEQELTLHSVIHPSLIIKYP